MGCWEPTVATMCRSFLGRKEATTVGQQGRGHCGLVTWALQGALGTPGKEGDMANAWSCDPVAGRRGGQGQERRREDRSSGCGDM